MPQISRPETEDQLCDAVAWAVAEGVPLEVIGGGSKRMLGRPAAVADNGAVLDLSALSGIALYEPEELVLSAAAATPLSEIVPVLAEAGQELAFEPPDYGPLLGLAAGAGTLGGLLATNLAGPRRFKAGAARDHFLGFRAVSGRGEVFKSGGRVVKNVTGYDLSKLIAGSWGTLAAMTMATVKVLPRAEEMRTVLLTGLDWAAAGRAMTLALQSPCEVSGAAYLPAAAARQVGLPADGVAALRVEGFGPSVRDRSQRLHALLSASGTLGELDAGASAAFWASVRDVMPFAADGDGRPVWKLSVPPAAGATLAAALTAGLNAEAFLDWGGGLVWLAVDAPADAAHRAVRTAVAAVGGHATLIRADASIRAAVPVFEPQPEGLAALSRRVKESFDPRGILNPGRIYDGA
ncbi:MAG: glycolate oxidase subunit GlcE [Alphaproteobacteria bacterium]